MSDLHQAYAACLKIKRAALERRLKDPSLRVALKLDQIVRKIAHMERGSAVERHRDHGQVAGAWFYGAILFAIAICGVLWGGLKGFEALVRAFGG